MMGIFGSNGLLGIGSTARNTQSAQSGLSQQANSSHNQQMGYGGLSAAAQSAQAQQAAYAQQQAAQQAAYAQQMHHAAIVHNQKQKELQELEQKLSELVSIEVYIEHKLAYQSLIKPATPLTVDHVKELYKDRYSEQEIEEIFCYYKLQY